MTNLDSIFKSRDITLSTKVHLVKAVFAPAPLCVSGTLNRSSHLFQRGWAEEEMKLHSVD